MPAEQFPGLVIDQAMTPEVKEANDAIESRRQSYVASCEKLDFEIAKAREAIADPNLPNIAAKLSKQGYELLLVAGPIIDDLIKLSDGFYRSNLRDIHDGSIQAFEDVKVTIHEGLLGMGFLPAEMQVRGSYPNTAVAQHPDYRDCEDRVQEIFRLIQAVQPLIAQLVLARERVDARLEAYKTKVLASI